MPEPVKITDEMVKAFVDSYEEGCCNDSSADWCCTRHALARVTPLIAAQVLGSAAARVQQRSEELRADFRSGAYGIEYINGMEDAVGVVERTAGEL